MDGTTTPAETARNAATLLSTTGALVLGLGLGALLGDRLGPAGWWLAGFGLLAHLWGMVSARRVQRAHGYRFARWETWGYWLCWLLLAAGVVAASWLLVRG